MITYDANAGVLHYREATTISLATGLPVFLDAGATITFRVQTTAHVDVSGQTWPVTMACIVPGYFIGVLDTAVDITPLGEYIVVCNVTFGGQALGHWEIPLEVLERRG
jgi:hypothetical protein